MLKCDAFRRLLLLLYHREEREKGTNSSSLYALLHAGKGEVNQVLECDVFTRFL